MGIDLVSQVLGDFRKPLLGLGQGIPIGAPLGSVGTVVSTLRTSSNSGRGSGTLTVVIFTRLVISIYVSRGRIFFKPKLS
jgi:hypothetical protein